MTTYRWTAWGSTQTGTLEAALGQKLWLDTLIQDHADVIAQGSGSTTNALIPAVDYPLDDPPQAGGTHAVAEVHYTIVITSDNRDDSMPSNLNQEIIGQLTSVEVMGWHDMDVP